MAFPHLFQPALKTVPGSQLSSMAAISFLTSPQARASGIFIRGIVSWEWDFMGLNEINRSFMRLGFHGIRISWEGLMGFNGIEQ